MVNDKLVLPNPINVIININNKRCCNVCSSSDLFNAYVLKSGIETERSWSTEDLNLANQSVTNSLSSLMECSARVSVDLT